MTMMTKKKKSLRVMVVGLLPRQQRRLHAPSEVDLVMVSKDRLRIESSKVDVVVINNRFVAHEKINQATGNGKVRLINVHGGVSSVQTAIDELTEEMGMSRPNKKQTNDHPKKSAAVVITELKAQLEQAERAHKKLDTESTQMAASYKKRIVEITEELEKRKQEIGELKSKIKDRGRQLSELEAASAKRIDELNDSHGKQVAKLRAEREEMKSERDRALEIAEQLRAQNEKMEKDLIEAALEDQVSPHTIEVPPAEDEEVKDA